LINYRMWQIKESQKIQNTKKQIELGNAQHLLLSGDMCLKLMFKKWGGKGLENIPSYTLPAIRASGISEEDIQMMVVENPKRIFCY
jgi:phosphotriesterase-related protein